MKKLLTLLLTLLMVFTLVGCNSKEDAPVVQEPEKQEEVEETKEEPEIVGGYVNAEDGTLTDELKDIFNKALEGLTGAAYEPQELVATQVVAGTNYKFLASGSKTTNPITKGTYYITIYKDLQGNVSLLDIETIEEKQEEAPKQDVTQMSFWVVFYDQYGNELQREALKYGTVPEYKTSLPEGFDKWVYKKSGKDVGKLKAITGNTYYQAVCHEVYHSSSDPTPGPTPGPTPPAPIDASSYTMKSGTTWFNTFTTPTNKNQITDIIFTNSAPSGSVEDVNLTADTTGNVKGYIVPNGGNYKIYVVGDYIYGNTNCSQMFSGFTSLTTLDFGDFNTSLVENMSAMFGNCSSLTSLNLSNFNTSNVNDMQGMFGSSGLTSLNLSNFNTSSVTSMNMMFYNCSGLASINLDSFNTSLVSTMSGMFNGSSDLTSLDLSSFNTTSVTNMSSMFNGCSDLTSLNLSTFTASSVTSMNYMFKNCTDLTSLDISLFNPVSAANISDMFAGCSSLASVKNNAENDVIRTALSGLGTCSYNPANSSFEITH